MAMNRRVLAYSALYIVGVVLFFLPTGWVIQWYGLVLALVVGWSALAGFAIYLAPKRVWLIATLGPMSALLIVIVVQVVGWVPFGMIP